MINIFKYIRIRYFLLFFIGVIVFSLILTISPDMAYSSEPTEICLVQVCTGDTLWKIAAEYNYNNIDMRRLVYIIMERNQLSDASIHPGQILEVPILY